MGDVLPPSAFALRCACGDAVSPTAKAGKTTGASVKLFKEMSPARDRSGLPFARFWVAGRIALPFRSAMSEL